MRTTLKSKRGFSLVEVLIAGALVTLAAMAGVAYVTRGAQHADWARDKVFARQKALSMLAELRAYVEGGEGEVAADLDGFDDGLGVDSSLTIQPDPNDPGAYLPSDHPVSGNVRNGNEWRWLRRITVRRFPGVDTRDLRICTVRMFRMRDGDVFPGEQMAEVSSVIRTIGDAFPTTQVYDLYLLALENVPGWWVYMDAIQPFIEATLTDLESRNPGLKFRAHWITKLGYGRDEEYAPYTNESRSSTDPTPWTYVYPGRMPAGESAQRYYVADRFGARMNLDGETTPSFQNGYAPTESYVDTDGNGKRDAGEPFTDDNGNGQWDLGNPVPYALADMQNHCMRYFDAKDKFDRRVAAGVDTDDTPTWRLLLDRMVAEPDRYHNAILINLHGELLPMPPTRNYSDAARSPDAWPGWRVVTHPERLRSRRVQGSDALSDAPRYRVYAYKTEFPAGHVPVMTLEEPFYDTNHSGAWEPGETFEDWNGDGVHNPMPTPISITVPGGDFSGAPNAVTAPSILIRNLAGGIDADGSGSPDAYAPFASAKTYPEVFGDVNGDGIRQLAEAFFDKNGDGILNLGEPHAERDGDGIYGAVTESLVDADGDNMYDSDAPEEPYTDVDGNGQWDPAEPYWDADKNGIWTAPTTPIVPWRPWDPKTDDANETARQAYIANYGEPFQDVDGSLAWTTQEPFSDYNQNGVRDAGVRRGEMWYRIGYDPTANATYVLLHGTPLEAPAEAGRGLPSTWRLYDLDYVPCPTPSTTTDTSRFSRDLYASGDFPKNTARWTIELPLPAVRSAFATIPGGGDGDASDRVIWMESRIGTNFGSGEMWPIRNEPTNRTRTYTYFYGDGDDIPFSERYQVQGDPRHCPYADLDAQGNTFAHGYNWYFDDMRSGGDATGQWLAFDSNRMRQRWLGRGSGHDVPRILSWLRTAVAKTEAVYTTLTGFSYYYLSLGGDVGYDSANGFPNSIPMDGTPFGLSGAVNENTLIPLGTDSIRGSIKYVRSNDGSTAGIRSGGYWWSKPWIGELCQDSAYATQWVPWGNLRADTGSSAGEYRMVKRGSITGNQLPTGTDLYDAYSRLATEGCVSVFNIGNSSSTFHHQFESGKTGSLSGDGPQLAQNYNFPLPTSTAISRPFGISTSGSGTVGDEFAYTAEYPRFSATKITEFYNHQNGQTGSGVVLLQEPGPSPRGGFVVVNGIDRTTESGSAFIARYSMLSLVHSFFAAGVPGPSNPNRISQLPRLQIRNPTLVTELENPASIVVRWSTEWTRWDGLYYTQAYPNGFSEDETDLVYVLMYSPDNGKSWRNMRDDSEAEPGVIPWIDGVGVDPDKVVQDTNPGDDEAWTWTTPTVKFPEGSYLIRIEGYRSSESLHFVQHMEKIYVNR